MMRRRRRGATVAELAIALVLAGVAAALGAGLLVAAERRSRRDGTDSLAAQTARDVLHAVGSEVAASRWNATVTRGDTALDLQAHVGLSVVCALSSDLLVLPGAITSLGNPFTIWRSPPEAVDIVAAWDTSGAGGWSFTTVDSVTSSVSGAGCAASGPFRSLADSLAQVPVTRLRLAYPPAPGVGVGAPVRIFRAVRWSIYRGGDSRWWLGQRRCPAGSCGTIQPVAGPLAPPADSGLRFSLQADGSVSVVVRAEVRDSRSVTGRRTFTVRGTPRATP